MTIKCLVLLCMQDRPDTGSSGICWGRMVHKHVSAFWTPFDIWTPIASRVSGSSARDCQVKCLNQYNEYLANSHLWVIKGIYLPKNPPPPQKEIEGLTAQSSQEPSQKSTSMSIKYSLSCCHLAGFFFSHWLWLASFHEPINIALWGPWMKPFTSTSSPSLRGILQWNSQQCPLESLDEKIDSASSPNRVIVVFKLSLLRFYRFEVDAWFLCFHPELKCMFAVPGAEMWLKKCFSLCSWNSGFFQGLLSDFPVVLELYVSL